MQFHFQKKYFAWAIVLFLVEVVIAAFVRDSFVRPYVGDFLVVIFIYCFLKTFWKAEVSVVALATLLFAYFVEISQYFKLIYVLGWQDSTAARLILGNSFQWGDLVAYTLGVGLVVVIEQTLKDKKLGK